LEDALTEHDRKRDLFDQLAVVGKAFASAKRLEIIDLLSQGERTVESLSRAVGLGVSTASAHLQILKLTNVVRTRRVGTRIYYSLAGEDVAALYVALGEVARKRSADVERAHGAYLGVSDAGPVDEISREELQRLLQGGKVQVLDVRPPEEFAAGHIPGAQSVPFGDLVQRLESLRGADIVAYCRGAYCVMAHDAVRLLNAHGSHASRLQDGMLEWRLAGLPVAVGA